MHPLYEYGIYSNRHLWFHILGGAVLAKLLLLVLVPQLVLLFVGIVAVGYEVYQYIKEFKRAKETWSSEFYKSLRKRFLLDSYGDIAGALIAALVVVL